MRKKEAQIRRRNRDRQLDQIKAQIRQQTLRSFSFFQRSKQCSSILKDHISNANIDLIFEFLVNSEDTNVDYVDQQTVIECYLLISKTKIALKELLILQKLIEIHFDVLFQKQELITVNRGMIQMVTSGADTLVGMIHRGEIDENGAASLGLNSYISIIKTLHTKLTNKMKNEGQDNLVKLLAGDIGRIIFWGQSLLMNDNYLTLLVKLIALNEISIKQNNYLSVFHNKIFLMKILEMTRQNTRKADNAYAFLNSIIELTDLSLEFVQNLLPDFVSLVIEKGKKYLFKVNRQSQDMLFKGICSLSILLNFVVLQPSSGSSTPCFHFDYFNLLLTLLNSEQQNRKTTIFHAIQLSIKLISEHHYHSVLNYLSPQSLEQISISLNSQNIYLQVKAVKILLLILRLPNSSPQQLQSTIYEFYNYEIPQTLERLQYNHNKELSMLSQDLLQNQFQEQEMTYDESGRSYERGVSHRQDFI